MVDAAGAFFKGLLQGGLVAAKFVAGKKEDAQKHVRALLVYLGKTAFQWGRAMGTHRSTVTKCQNEVRDRPTGEYAWDFVMKGPCSLVGDADACALNKDKNSAAKETVEAGCVAGAMAKTFGPCDAKKEVRSCEF